MGIYNTNTGDTFSTYDKKEHGVQQQRQRRLIIVMHVIEKVHS